ncbi:MAG: endonuclease III [Haloglomus sp.]
MRLSMLVAPIWAGHVVADRLLGYGLNSETGFRDTPTRNGTTEEGPARGWGMGTPLDSREAQADEVIDRLYEQYPEPEISLEFSDRLELLVAVVLSAQCTDERVNDVTDDLFEKYQSPADYAGASEEQLAEDIYGITFHNNKAGYLKGIGEILVEEHDGEVPDTMAELTDLPGVGRKTANVVLQHGHEVVEGIVVDTHVQRISRRLGLTEEERPEAIEQDLMGVVPEDEWREFTHLLISHGRETCTARSPDCGECVLADICPSEQGDADVDLASGEAW